MNDERWQVAARSPLGGLVASLDRHGRIVGLVFDDGRAAPGALPTDVSVQRLVDRWFAHGEATPDAIAWPGATRFRQQIWQAVMAIGRGRVCSYGALAVAVGRPGAARAVGRALACNPILLLVPCHRVLGGDGALRGYAGGLARKRRLLALEGVLPG